MVAVSGLFITLEGIDGSGKTTQARLLVDWLSHRGHQVCATREPGGSEAGERIRDLLLSPQRFIPPEAELFLYLADRAVHVTSVVRPALAQGGVVVCERHADSTLAYQGYGRGLDLALLRNLNAIATGGLVPDLSVVLDLSPSQARLDASRLDRLESAGRDFMARVAEGFRELARAEPERMKLVDAAADVGAVHGEISALLGRLLEGGRPSGAMGGGVR
jgi:dTMP kinase